MGKFISGQQAATMIKDGASVWLSGGGGGINDPDCLLKNIEDHFLETGHPADLIFYHSAGIGNKMGGGADRFAHEGMVKKVTLLSQFSALFCQKLLLTVSQVTCLFALIKLRILRIDL